MYGRALYACDLVIPEHERRPVHTCDDWHDVALVRRSQAGDGRALESLMRRYQRVLYSVALRMLGDAETAREVTCAALVRTRRSIPARDPNDGFFHIAHRLLVETCLSKLGNGATPGALPRATPAGAVPFFTLSFDARQARLQAALLQLPPEWRAVVILRHVGGLSYDETAITLEIARERVRCCLHAGRQWIGELAMAWPSCVTVDAESEALLQDAVDGELDARGREARDHLVAAHDGIRVRAAALRDLGQFLNELGPAEPPADLLPQVLAECMGAVTDCRSVTPAPVRTTR
jgi:RNA polymerase sigma-70 factor (ECF subfamily)